jgi:3'-5' exoribonuclease
MKTKFIKDLQVGEEVNGFVAVVKSCQIKKTRNGDDFRSLTLADKTGEINATIWENAFARCVEVEDGKVVYVSGAVDDYKGATQIKVSGLTPVDEKDIDPADFRKVSAKNFDEMIKTIEKTLKSFKNKNLKKLVESFYKNKDWLSEFKQAPGAEYIHHAYVGGLMEHAVEMLNFSDAVAKEFPLIDLDLVKAGILLHDIGKMRELEGDLTVSRTVEGHLLGHLVISLNQINQAIDKIPNFPAELRNRILHLICSHHGQLEFGSPVNPMMTEAWILHLVDLLSTRINTSYQKTLESQDKKGQFTDRVFSLNNSHLYIPKNVVDDASDETNTLF